VKIITEKHNTRYMETPMNFPPLTWFDLGALIGVVFGSLAVLVAIVGYLDDVLRVRRRKRIVAEAREMVRLIQKGAGHDKG
jgi:UDP-N-acetylmuramyl pentapeptide phosphotransferase/UDP-N-acetylglucosamine-1-phosphate transferase